MFTKPHCLQTFQCIGLKFVLHIREILGIIYHIYSFKELLQNVESNINSNKLSNNHTQLLIDWRLYKPCCVWQTLPLSGPPLSLLSGCVCSLHRTTTGSGAPSWPAASLPSISWSMPFITSSQSCKSLDWPALSCTLDIPWSWLLSFSYSLVSTSIFKKRRADVFSFQSLQINWTAKFWRLKVEVLSL